MEAIRLLEESAAWETSRELEYLKAANSHRELWQDQSRLAQESRAKAEVYYRAAVALRQKAETPE